jgi:hypothetical protein
MRMWIDQLVCYGCGTFVAKSTDTARSCWNSGLDIDDPSISCI